MYKTVQHNSLCIIQNVFNHKIIYILHTGNIYWQAV